MLPVQIIVCFQCRLTSGCLQCYGGSDTPVVGDAVLLQLLQPTPQGGASHILQDTGRTLLYMQVGVTAEVFKLGSDFDSFDDMWSAGRVCVDSQNALNSAGCIGTTWNLALTYGARPLPSFYACS